MASCSKKAYFFLWVGYIRYESKIILFAGKTSFDP